MSDYIPSSSSAQNLPGVTEPVFTGGHAALPPFGFPRDPYIACSRCGSASSLSPVAVCQAIKGLLENHGRHYQRCNCGCHLWLEAACPPGDLPEDIRIRIAIRDSTAKKATAHSNASPSSTGKANRILCANSGCQVGHHQRPARANKSCSRPLPFCKGCCLASGGCSYEPHRRSRHASGSSSNATVASSSKLSLSPVSGGPASPNPTPALPVPASYMRLAPTHLMVAKPGVSAPNTLPSKKTQIANMVTLKIHTENETVHPHRVFSPDKDVFVLDMHIDQLAKLNIIFDTMVQWFDPASNEWVTQGVDAPIEIPSNRIITLARIGVVPPLFSPEKGKGKAPQLSRDVILDMPNRPANAAPSSDEEYDCDSVGSATHTKRFPLMYACEMVPGLQVLRDKFPSNRNRTTLPEEFPRVFLGCSFKASTYQKHRGAWRKADEYGILERYVAAGKTADGLWARLVQEVEARRALEDDEIQEIEPPQGAAPANSIIEHAVFKHEWREFIDEHTGDADFGGVFHPDQVFSIFQESLPLCVGSRKTVYRITFDDQESGALMTYVAKQYNQGYPPKNSSDMRLVAPPFSLSNFYRIDAEHFARGNEIVREFQQLAHSKSMVIYNFSFANTYLFEAPSDDGEGPYWQCQAMLDMTASEDVAVTGTEAIGVLSGLRARTLNAFIHYTYWDLNSSVKRYFGFEYDNKPHLCFDNLQGFDNGTSVTLVDMTTYTSVGGEFYHFAQKHSCTAMCTQLGLPPASTIA
ncbi:hypothetical protein BOTBODRAFT_189848 [Botryobasidium botryosum FD-172 SS1]|uniref:Alpha-type protein kinase domain-containing protein n=1 Tax=Botryobasidium botryosum (strain FD-172 SS1) TaxID=930990 RepID=A0A067M7G0_BOTB1|nr:hypothetical protein BOTBODRAFT_189848 [Botryobasidium botryosum FD-172 SS1]